MLVKTVLLWIAGLSLLLWLVTLVRMAIGLRSVHSLREVAEPTAEIRLPRVSVVVAARDEAAAIEAGVTSLLTQRYPQLEIVVVNDRSSDGTGAILDRVADGDPRLRVIHNREVPPGWLGKNHALHLGAQRAAGELILFTDADVVLEPTALARAVALLEREQLDHLAVGPDVHVPGYWAGAFVGFFAIAFSLFTQPWRVRDPRSDAHVGIGAFNLVRSRAYQAIGGHSRLPMRPDDDLKLGKVLKTSGFRQDLAFGKGMVSVDWYPGLGAMIRGLEKNSFSAVDYSLPAALGASVLVVVLNIWPWVALLVTGGLTWLLNAAVVACTFMVWVANRGAPGVRLRYFPVYPVGAALFTYTFLRSAFVTLRQGGIRWRETYYPLAELRANRV
jgi:cellulose synthase/poly-beta-1,6-N-acetylglucosamine synthase-like glycosyltransferase